MSCNKSKLKKSIVVKYENIISLKSKATKKLYLRNWAYYKVISNYFAKENSVKLKFLSISNNKNISYQSHKYRDEVWYILKGMGN